MENINILVTGTGSLIGQAIIKSVLISSLKDNINLVGCDYFQNTVGSFWCNSNYILPDILKHNSENEWYNQIKEIILREKVNILFIGVDFELILFAKYKNEIEKETNCKIIVSDKKVLEIGNDKFLTAAFLQENKINFPETSLVENFANSSIQFPCIIKPRVGARSKGVYIVNSYEELIEKSAMIENGIAQELIGDFFTEYTCGVLCIDGKFESSIVLQRTLKEGHSYIAEYKKDFSRSIYDYIKVISEKLQPFGSCNLQLRLDSSGTPFLFEINPRFSGTTYMRALLGYNEVEFMIRYSLGLPCISFSLQEGKVLRFYEERLL